MDKIQKAERDIRNALKFIADKVKDKEWTSELKTRVSHSRSAIHIANKIGIKTQDTLEDYTHVYKINNLLIPLGGVVVRKSFKNKYDIFLLVTYRKNEDEYKIDIWVEKADDSEYICGMI